MSKKIILKFHDMQHGELTIVVPKIREIYHGLGDIVIRYDNGDARTLQTSNVEQSMKELEDAITEFYN